MNTNPLLAVLVLFLVPMVDIEVECTIIPDQDHMLMGGHVILVEMSNSETITLIVKDTDTIATVKAKIQEMGGIPVDQQQLVFEENKLEDFRTLSYYNIYNMSRIKLHSSSSQLKF